MRLYKEFGCEILIEAPGVRNEKDMVLVEQLLTECDDDGASIIEEETISSNENIASLPSPKRRRTNDLIPSSQVSKESLQKPAILLFGSHDVRLHDNVALQLSSFHFHV